MRYLSNEDTNREIIHCLLKLGTVRQSQLCCSHKVRSFQKAQLFFALLQLSTFHYSHFWPVPNEPAFYLAEVSLYVYAKITMVPLLDQILVRVGTRQRFDLLFKFLRE